MIRKIFTGIVVLLIAAASVWLFSYFYSKNKQDPTIYETAKPEITDIIKKTVATGSIVPRVEVEIKPQVSGVISELLVEAGDQVQAGQLIARVKLVQSLAENNSDQVNVNNAKNNLQTAEINLRNAKIELDRQKQLYDQKVISQQEYNRFLLDYNVQKEAARAAERNLMLVNQRILQNSGAVSNEIYATSAGTVLDVPVKIGTSVVGRGNFNEGTTIASIADMASLIFEGKIDESEVGKIREGMPIELTIGAIEEEKYAAKLEFIAPKGVEEEGAIKFEIRAALDVEAKNKLRAGYSASADIVLGKREKVLAIKESMLQFDKENKDKPYVEIEVSKQKFKKQYVKTGISDGINIEILSGVKKGQKIKLPITTEEDKKKEEKES